MPYPFQADTAFLGHNCRRPVVRYSFDGRRLVCWEAWQQRASILVIGAFFGPGLSSVLVLGMAKPLPWIALAVVIALNGFAWLGWIDALRNRLQVDCDLVAREIQFFLNPRRGPAYTLNLDRVTAVRIDTLRRDKHQARIRPVTGDMIQRYGIVAIDCYSLVLDLIDGEAIHLLETTDLAVPEAIQQVLQPNLPGSPAMIEER